MNLKFRLLPIDKNILPSLFFLKPEAIRFLIFLNTLKLIIFGMCVFGYRKVFLMKQKALHPAVLEL
jgi:hypothetical protein